VEQCGGGDVFVSSCVVATAGCYCLLTHGWENTDSAEEDNDGQLSFVWRCTLTLLRSKRELAVIAVNLRSIRRLSRAVPSERIVKLDRRLERLTELLLQQLLQLLLLIPLTAPHSLLSTSSFSLPLLVPMPVVLAGSTDGR